MRTAVDLALGSALSLWILLPSITAQSASAQSATAAASESPESGGDANWPALPAPDGPWFVDVTEASGLDFVHFNGMAGKFYFNEAVGGGGALFDYDGDGDLDLFAVQGKMLGGQPLERAILPPPEGTPPFRDRLFRNDLGADGTVRFVDVTAASGIDSRGYGIGAAAADYDNDGDIDLYVVNFDDNELWRNRGDGTFENVTEAAGAGDGRFSAAASWLDYDGDGWLDLYIVNYVDYRVESGKECFGISGKLDYCGPVSFEPTPDRLLRNQGDGTFRDVSGPSGITAEVGAGLGSITDDFDGDGRIDLYVTNDGDPNFLWRNRGDGTFEDLALLGGSAVNMDGVAEASMGVDAADIDLDGDPDLFMAHLTQETNTLYLNDGDGFFEDGTSALGLDLPSWTFTGYGTRLFDFDGDARLDVVVANGAVKTIEELAAAGDPFPLHQIDQLFRNVDGRYVEVTKDAGEAFERSLVSRGIALGDIDRDGDPDLVIFANAGPTRILRNEVGNRRPWIGLEVHDPTLGRDALGARVGIVAGARPVLWRRVRTDGSYAAAGDPRWVIGLADYAGETVDVVVEWPSGPEERFTALAVGRYHRLEKGAGASSGAGSGSDGANDGTQSGR